MPFRWSTTDTSKVHSVRGTMKYARSRSPSSEGTCASYCSATTIKSRRTYNRIKVGLRRSIPAAIVLWAFHKIPSHQGLTSRRVISFLKKHYKVVDDPGRTGKSIGAMLRCAVDFGLLEKRGKKYFLSTKTRWYSIFFLDKYVKSVFIAWPLL